MRIQFEVNGILFPNYRLWTFKSYINIIMLTLRHGLANSCSRDIFSANIPVFPADTFILNIQTIENNAIFYIIT